MDTTGTPNDGGDDTRADIMAATYRALCRHGYAALTMQAIADEFEKSKALLHYHYDTKQDLLVAFLEYLLEQFEDRITIEEVDGPADRLDAFIDVLLFGRTDGQPPDSDHWEFHTALLEIRAQAPYQDAYRDQLTRNYDAVEESLIAIIDQGIDAGAFTDADPEATAALILAAINGARLHQVSLDRDDLPQTTRQALDEQVIEPLRTTDGSEEDG
ncbi:MAG: TetR/AcrR family transcriptional regulator [Halobacteriales archaeon]|nr:TetR/AcrR family transcriptional regulator [Halobacteriales archaeon]